MLGVIKHQHISSRSLCGYDKWTLWHESCSEQECVCVIVNGSRKNYILSSLVIKKYSHTAVIKDRIMGHIIIWPQRSSNRRHTLQRPMELPLTHLFTSPSWLILMSISIFPLTEPNPPYSTCHMRIRHTTVNRKQIMWLSHDCQLTSSIIVIATCIHLGIVIR